MKWWKLVIAGVVLALAAWGVSAELLSGLPVEAASVRKSSIRQYVDEQGKTRLPNVHLITMPTDGRIQEISLVEHDPVKAGEVVAQIVPSDLEEIVAEAQAAVDRLDASIAENRDISVETTSRKQALAFVESMEHAVAAANARMTSGNKKLEYSEDFLGRIRKLFTTGAKTEDDVQRAEVDYVESQVNYQQDVLVWRAMEAIKAATQLLPEMVLQYIDRKELSRAVLEKERAEAVARLHQAQTMARRGTMTSPVDGVVLQREESNERYLSAGTVLLTIGRLEELEVEADILSQDVVDVRPDQEVEIYGPAIGRDPNGAGTPATADVPATPYGAGPEVSGVRGVVARIYPAGFTKISSLGVEQQRVRVIIRFAPGVLDRLRTEHDLGVDYRVRVRIYTATKDQTLIVPRSALFRGADGGWEVFAVRGGRAALVPVKVGLLNDQHAEIASGLSDGEVVVLAPETSLVSGARVKPIVRGK